MNRRHFIKASTASLLGVHSIVSARDSQNPEVETMIGQMIMVGFQGLHVHPQHSVIKTIQQVNIGGVVLFDYNVATKTYSRNIASPEQVKNLIRNLQSWSDIPLFIAIDYEGGKVNRLKKRSGFFNIPSVEEMGRLNSKAYTSVITDRMSRTLAELGFNLNFAPVLDLNINPSNPVIGKLGRSFSSNPETVIYHSRLWIETHRSYRILCALKHFPGHGSSFSDSHLGMVDITNTWQQQELQPYERLIKENIADAVMTAHVFHRGIDRDRPATLSNKILSQLLRQQLGFKGLIISDDMQMKAITRQFGLSEAVLYAINAGVDVLLFANNTTYHEENIALKVKAIIKEHLREGRITEARIRESYERILSAKQKCTSLEKSIL